MPGVAFNPEIHKRRSIRLKNYDYLQNGGYFITVCVKNSECILGEIRNGKTQSSHIGEIVKNCWFEISSHFKNVILDQFVIMPNHVHGILFIDHCKGVACNVPTARNNFHSAISPKPKSLPTIIRSFKSAVSNICNKNNYHFQWHRNYYEHIIRNEHELNRIRKYIMNNPLQWELDLHNCQV